MHHGSFSRYALIAQGLKMNISTIVVSTALLLGGAASTATVLAHGVDKHDEATTPATLNTSSALNITDARAHATVPAQPVGAVYMTISSTSPLTLVKAESDVAKDVQIHDMHKDHGVMKMREQKNLKIGEGEKLVLAPGGMHVMLLGLKRQLKSGETISLTLRFEDQNKKQITKTLDVPVQPLGKK